MKAELERIRSGGALIDVETETKAICEVITGISYDEIWRYHAAHFEQQSS